MTKDEVVEFMESLTPEQRKDIIGTLMKRERDSARSRAISLASALEANLKVAGCRDMAAEVSSILSRLLQIEPEE